MPNQTTSTGGYHEQPQQRAPVPSGRECPQCFGTGRNRKGGPCSYCRATGRVSGLSAFGATMSAAGGALITIFWSAVLLAIIVVILVSVL